MGVDPIARLAMLKVRRFGRFLQLGQMLVERSLALYVHRLTPHADAQRGKLPLFREGEDREVEILAFFCRELCLGVLLLTIQMRIEVIAAGDEEAIDQFEKFSARG